LAAGQSLPLPLAEAVEANALAIATANHSVVVDRSLQLWIESRKLCHWSINPQEFS